MQSQEVVQMSKVKKLTGMPLFLPVFCMLLVTSSLRLENFPFMC